MIISEGDLGSEIYSGLERWAETGKRDKRGDDNLIEQYEWKIFAIMRWRKIERI
jgi:hypothetical protein